MSKSKFAFIIILTLLFVGCSTAKDDYLNWKKLITPTNEDISGIYFPDSDLGYAVTVKGSILKTTDGGQTFTILDYQAPQILNDAFFLSDEQGFIFGKNGYLAKTTDGGDNWQTITIDANYELTGMNFLNDDYGFLSAIIQSGELANRGVIGFSQDEGESWKFDTTEYFGFSFVDILKKNHVWVSGTGKIVYSTDKGQSWERTSTGNQQDIINNVYFTSVQHGWCTGDNALLMNTSNGGWSWNRLDPIINRDYTCLISPSFNVVYLAGENFVAGSKSYGNKWLIDSTTYQVTFTDFHWDDDDLIYLSGSGGTLLKLEL